MGSVHRLTQRARRRVFRREATRRLGGWLLIGALTGAALVLAQRTLGFDAPWWLLLGVPVLIGAVGALIVSAGRTPGALGVAIELDERLGLDGALANGVALALKPERSDFARIAIEDAERGVERVDVKYAIDVRYPWTWGAWPVATALGVACALFVPQLYLLGARAERHAVATRTTQERIEREDTARLVDQARQEIVQRAGDLATPDEIDALRDLERQLSAGEIAPDEARREASRQLDQAAERLDREAAASAEARDALARELSTLPSPDDAPDGDLGEAIRRGDFDGAESIVDSARRTDDAARREDVASELERLAERLRELRDRPAEAARAEREAREMLRELGLDESQIDEALGTNDAEEARRTLEDEGVAPDVAERIRERLEDAQREREAAERADESLDDLADAADEAARELREPPRQDPSTGAPGPGVQDPAAQDPVAQNREEQSGRDPNAPRTEGERREPGQPDERSGDQRQPGAQDEDGARGEQGESARSREPGEEPGRDGDPAARPRDGASPESAEGERQGEGERPGDKPGAEGAEGSRDPSRIGDTERPESGEQGDRPEGEGGEGARESSPIEGARQTPGEDDQGTEQGAAEGAEGERSPADRPPDGAARPGGAEQGQDAPTEQGAPGGSGERTPSEQTPSEQAPGAQTPGEGMPGQDHGPGQDQGQRQGQDQGEAPDASQRGAGSGAGDEQGPGAGRRPEDDPNASGSERFREMMRRMRERSPEDAARDSEALRERARELLGDEQADRWGARQRPEGDPTSEQADPFGPTGPEAASGFDEERVHAGDTGDGAPGGRVVGEWMGDGRGGAGSGAIDEGTARRVIGQAERGASRAVDDRRVPRRLAPKLREFYRRLPSNLIEPRGAGDAGADGTVGSGSGDAGGDGGSDGSGAAGSGGGGGG